MGNDYFQPLSVFYMLPGIMFEIDGVIDEAYFHGLCHQKDALNDKLPSKI